MFSHIQVAVAASLAGTYRGTIRRHVNPRGRDSPSWLVANGSRVSVEASRAGDGPRLLNAYASSGDDAVPIANVTNSTGSSRENDRPTLLKQLIVIAFGITIVLSSMLLGTMVWYHSEQRHARRNANP